MHVYNDIHKCRCIVLDQLMEPKQTQQKYVQNIMQYNVGCWLVARFGIVAHFLQIILNSEPMYCLDGSLLWQESLGNYFFLKKNSLCTAEKWTHLLSVFARLKGPTSEPWQRWDSWIPHVTWVSCLAIHILQGENLSDPWNPLPKHIGLMPESF